MRYLLRLSVATALTFCRDGVPSDVSRFGLLRLRVEIRLSIQCQK